MMRLFLLLFVSALFGLVIAFLSRGHDKPRLYVFAGLAGFAGMLAATLLQIAYPVLFDHLFSWESWFEWLPFVGSGFALLLLPRSLILLPLGFGAGWAIVGAFKKEKREGAWHWQALFAYAAGFLLVWGCGAEHLPSGVKSRTYVYRVAGTAARDVDREAFVEFLEWNWSPHFGYESYSRGLSLSFLSGLLKIELGNDGPPVYVFVKEYWTDGKKTAELRTSCQGPLSSAELGARFRNFARSRCSSH